MTTAAAPQKTPAPTERILHLPRPHAAQRQIIASARRLNAVCCGRRWGKSTLGLDRLLEPALHGQPVAYFAPTYGMMTEFWREVVRTLRPVTARSNAAEHRLELVTGGVVDMWSLESPDVARGRKYARVVVDEAAMVPRLADAWDQVIRSTLADFGGDAWFLSTPKGFNDYHTLYQYGQSAQYPDWASWQMPTATNPHISRDELASLERDLPSRVFRQEILALFEAENEGALWTREWIDAARVPPGTPLELRRVVVAIDPSGSRRGDEVGVVVAGIDRQRETHAYVLEDRSAHLGPDDWAQRALAAYADHRADCILAEANFGGEMVQSTIAAMAERMAIRPVVKLVQASRGKVVRAEPCAVLSMQGRVHHVGLLPELENQLCLAADTPIMTERGERPIQAIVAGERVWTRQGWRRVLWAGQTTERATVYDVTTGEERRLRATAGHPVYTKERGFVPVSGLHTGDTLEVAAWASAARRSFTKAIATASTRPATTVAGPAPCSTAWSGKRPTAPSRRALRSITRMATRPIMTWLTSWPCPSPRTARSTSTALQHGPPSADAPRRWPPGSARSRGRSSVAGVRSPSNRPGHVRHSAPRNATRSTIGSVVRLPEQEPVYNLTVEGAHEYYANGILVHNCAWTPLDSYSPGRLDALVWALTELMLGGSDLPFGWLRRDEDFRKQVLGG